MSQLTVVAKSCQDLSRSHSEERRGEMGIAQTAKTIRCNEQFPRKAAMRSHEMIKDPTLKRDGAGMKSQEIVRQNAEALPAPFML